MLFTPAWVSLSVFDIHGALLQMSLWKFMCMKEEHPQEFLMMSSHFRGSSFLWTHCSGLCHLSQGSFSLEQPLPSPFQQELMGTCVTGTAVEKTSEDRSWSLETEYQIISYSAYLLHPLMMCGSTQYCWTPRDGLPSRQCFTVQGTWKKILNNSSPSKHIKV